MFLTGEGRLGSFLFFFFVFSAKAVQIKWMVEGEKRVRAAEQQEREGFEDEQFWWPLYEEGVEFEKFLRLVGN